MSRKKYGTLTLVRHGQSQWNKENRFTGWVDVDLSQEGIIECQKLAKKLKRRPFDVVYTSELKRAWRSVEIILAELKAMSFVIRHSALNERHYGDLQGMNKDEARERFGKEQVHRWRRGYRDRPPGGESLEDVSRRVIPYFERTIYQDVIGCGRSALVVAHGNSLRSIVMHIEKLTEEEVVAFEIPTAQPIFYYAEHGKLTRKRGK